MVAIDGRKEDTSFFELLKDSYARVVGKELVRAGLDANANHSHIGCNISHVPGAGYPMRIPVKPQCYGGLHSMAAKVNLVARVKCRIASIGARCAWRA